MLTAGSPIACAVVGSKLGVLQYVLIKNVLTILTFVLETQGLYGEGLFTWTKG